MINNLGRSRCSPSSQGIIKSNQSLDQMKHYRRFKQNRDYHTNKTPAKAFTPPAETKMGTRPGRAVTREFIGGGVYSLISVLPN